MLWAAGTVWAQCPGFPNCLYTPAQTYSFARSTVRVSYKDVAETTRTIEMTVRVPNRPGPLPVVIWAHGGEGRPFNSSGGALSLWGEISAETGYLSITPAFPNREGEERLALCRFLGVDGERCERMSNNAWDRPYDIRAILDELSEQNSAGPLRGRIDLARIGVAGHSAGSGGTLAVAGAVREFNGVRYGPSYSADPRPKAFVALSPSAPGSSWMFDTSWNDGTTSWTLIERPVLVLTGLGDENEQFGRGRRIAFDYMPAGDKFRLWVNDADFGHGAFGDNLGDCEGIPAGKCGVFRAVAVSTVRAFLDAYLEDKPQARRFLEEGYAAAAVPELLEWSKK